MSILRITRQADRDIRGIYRYLHKQNPAAATNVLEKLRDACILLAEEPGLGTPRSDLSRNLRVFRPSNPADAYLIFYYPISSGGVAISHIVHGARNWEKLFER
jgi:toxin ParE1/3/4